MPRNGESGTVDLTRGWLEHDGDNPAWAQPNFDDSGWQKVDLDDLGAATLGTRWYRLHVQLAPNHPHLHILIAGGEGTYEMYVNGQLVEGTQIAVAVWGEDGRRSACTPCAMKTRR